MLFGVERLGLAACKSIDGQVQPHFGWLGWMRWHHGLVGWVVCPLAGQHLHLQVGGIVERVVAPTPTPSHSI